MFCFVFGGGSGGETILELVIKIRLPSNSKEMPASASKSHFIDEVLGYQRNVCFNNDKIWVDMLAHVFNPSTGEANNLAYIGAVGQSGPHSNLSSKKIKWKYAWIPEEYFVFCWRV